MRLWLAGMIRGWSSRVAAHNDASISAPDRDSEPCSGMRVLSHCTVVQDSHDFKLVHDSYSILAPGRWDTNKKRLVLIFEYNSQKVITIP